MSNPRGTVFETAACKVAHEKGWPDAERIVKKGTKDEGDIRVVPDYAIECKDEQKLNVPGAIDEAIAEADHAGVPYAAALIKRRGKNASRAYLVQEWGQWLERERAIADQLAYLARLEAALAITDAVLETIGVSCRARGETLEVTFGGRDPGPCEACEGPYDGPPMTEDDVVGPFCSGCTGDPLKPRKATS